MAPRQDARKSQHRPTPAERDQRVKIDADPVEALRVLLGVKSPKDCDDGTADGDH